MESWSRNHRASGGDGGEAGTPKLPGRGNYRARMLDRYLGIPLVFALGTVHRRRQMPSQPERIGLLNTAAVGDTVLMSGPVADLRAQYQDSNITCLSGPSNYEAACLMDHVDEVIKLPVFDPVASIRLLRARQLDMLLDFGPWCRLNSLLSMFSGAGFTVGFRTRGEARHFCYDLVVEHSGDTHELENHRRIVRALGIQTRVRPTLQCKPSDDQTGDIPGAPYVVCHLWPGGSAARQKEWPAARWVALAEYLADRRYQVVFTGSANQRELNDNMISRMDASRRQFAHNAGGATLSRTLRILSNAELVVSVDTGIVHMAAALDVPLVALYGPSTAERWGPVSDRAVVVTSPLASSGYLNLGFEIPRNPPPCMEAISYESVETACDETLQRIHAERLMSAGSSRI